MGSDYELVRYEPHLKNEVIELQSHLWSPSKRLNTAYFEWKYERNPYRKEPLIYLALHNGKAVGMRGMFGVRWEAGSPARSFTGLYADDAVITPEHRNRGLMPRIMQAAFEDLVNRDCDYLFNLSAGAKTILTSLSMGWRSAGYERPMHWRSWRVAVPSGLRRLGKRVPFISRPGDSGCFRWLEPKCRTLLDLDKKQGPNATRARAGIAFQDRPRSEEMAALVQRIGPSGRIRHVRDREYFDWRFENPLSRYRFLYQDQDHLEGYVVLQENTSEFARSDLVNVVDWEATTPAGKAALLRTALDLVKNRSVMMWTATLDQESVELLRRYGFKTEPAAAAMGLQRPAILVRATHGQKVDDWELGGLKLTNLTSWDLRMLYSMRG